MRVCLCVCACRSCDGEGRKDKGGGEKVREVKTVVWIKLSIRIYVCRYLCISRKHAFFPTEHDVQERQHLRDEVGTWQNNTKQGAAISVQKRPRHHEDCQFQKHRLITDT